MLKKEFLGISLLLALLFLSGCNPDKTFFFGNVDPFFTNSIDIQDDEKIEFIKTNICVEEDLIYTEIIFKTNKGDYVFLIGETVFVIRADADNFIIGNYSGDIMFVFFERPPQPTKGFEESYLKEI